MILPVERTHDEKVWRQRWQTACIVQRGLFNAYLLPDGESLAFRAADKRTRKLPEGAIWIGCYTRKHSTDLFIDDVRELT